MTEMNNMLSMNVFHNKGNRRTDIPSTLNADTLTPESRAEPSNDLDQIEEHDLGNEFHIAKNGNNNQLNTIILEKQSAEDMTSSQNQTRDQFN